MTAAPNEAPISAAMSATAKILLVIIIAQCLLPEKFGPSNRSPPVWSAMRIPKFLLTSKNSISTPVDMRFCEITQ
jgi:hypothetical protein